MSIRANIGDIFQIPLSMGEKAYGQYMVMEVGGPIIRIFNLIVKKEAPDPALEEIINHNLLFAPIYSSLVSIRSGKWKVIGNKKVEDFNIPHFVYAYRDIKSNRVTKWFLYTGERKIFGLFSKALGDRLPNEYQSLEFKGVYSPDLVEKRIETGKDIYNSLKKTNKF